MSVFRDHSGKVSMMRIGFFVTLALGVIMCIAGTVGAFMAVKDAAVLLATGSGMITGSGWAKAVQTKWEKVDVRTQ